LKALRQCSKTWGYSFPTPSTLGVIGYRFFAIFAIFDGSFLTQRHPDGPLAKNLIESPPSVLKNVG